MYEKIRFYIVKRLTSQMLTHSVSDEANYTHVMIPKSLWKKLERFTEKKASPYPNVDPAQRRIPEMRCYFESSED